MSIRVPLAANGQHERIVEAIESYFTRLDDAVATLERVDRNLKRYRASVLKAAVEGRLVPTEAALAKQEGRDYEPASVLLERILAERRRRWSESGDKGKYTDPTAPDTTNLSALPEGWCWATVEQLALEIRYGTSAKTRKDGGHDIPVLRMGNIVEGYLDYSELKYLPSNHAEFPDLLLAPGDILFNRTNSPELVGKTAVVTQTASASFASYLIRVRVATDVQPRYVSHFINSPAGRQWIKRVVSQQVGQANVNGSKLKACAIPMPPAAEQARIVEEVERVFSLVFATALQTKHDLDRCARLRQSILKWAFEGRLADQDPNDQPASVFLEQIRAERDTVKPAKTSRPERSASKRRARA
jgi:type I restriction enzyme S subunit